MGVKLFSNAGILTGYGIGDRGFEGSDSFPFARSSDATAGADLVQSPVDFEAMAVGIKKLHGNLTARAAPSFKRDRSTVFAQPLAHVEDFGHRSDLESNVMQLRMERLPRATADQRDRMMIGMTT